MLLNLFFKKVIYFWLHWVFVAACGLSLVAESWGYSSLWCVGFSLWWLLLLWSTGSRCTGFSSYGKRAQQLWFAGSRVQAQQLWHTGLVALRHVGSSRTGAQTRVPCIGRWILNHCATREVLLLTLICPSSNPKYLRTQSLKLELTVTQVWSTFKKEQSIYMTVCCFRQGVCALRGWMRPLCV